MQEINLLRSQIKDTTKVWQRRNKITLSVLIVVLVSEAAGSGIFFLLNQQLKTRQESVRQQNQEIQGLIDQRQKDLTPAQNTQARFKNLLTLANNHIYWSNFFDELSNKTFSQARYVKLQTDQGGKIYLEGQVKTYSELGKLLLGLSTSDHIQRVKLVSTTPAQGDNNVLLFTLELTINNQLLSNKQ